MVSRSDVRQYLRDHIVGAIHLGQLRSGDRLPSVRETANQLGKNERTVRAAYAALEEEGLVEVRGRSGVFVAQQEIVGCKATEETARWLSSVIAEAWRRRVGVVGLPALIERFTRSRPVRCALVDEVEDAIAALRYELEQEWGFEVIVVPPAALERAADVDFFAATSFHAAAIHDAVARLGKPLVVLTVHPGLKDALQARIQQGLLTIVGVDPRFGERIAIVYSADQPGRVRFVNVYDHEAIAALDPDEPILLTRAASQKLGRVPVRLIFPHSPTLSPETASVLADILVRRNG